MAEKTARFFRVAVEGATASDGRIIERVWLEQMAASYNPDTYAARVNMEHIRSPTADGPFKMYGDVLALKTEEVEIEIDGKTEKRLALFAQIDPTEDLIKFNKARQKKFTSIEVEPNFSNTGKAYLMGLAVTDSPASLGTEALTFSATSKEPFAATLKAELDARKHHKSSVFSAAYETDLNFDATDDTKSDGLTLDRLMAAFARAFGLNAGTKPEAPAPVVQASTTPAPVAATAQTDTAALATAFTQFGTELKALFAENAQSNNARFAKIETDLGTLTKALEETPNGAYTRRPSHNGGDGQLLADC
ncbi:MULTISPECIES: GPO family capsid scaffolding protein [unclassified Brevundimonas]|uniref:GPO family capsid scaffolding protein n=1 Tax=unclassified Brevundimonas TaxID=2622653 RepID=UPI0025C6AB76|nr:MULTISPECIES: GPO family capsid scaffolding protein [unclassified Brevundimonas]